MLEQASNSGFIRRFIWQRHCILGQYMGYLLKQHFTASLLFNWYYYTDQSYLDQQTHFSFNSKQIQFFSSAKLMFSFIVKFFNSLVDQISQKLKWEKIWTGQIRKLN
jgi:hypothetical protein